MRAVMMKNRRTAWTNMAVITPPASSNALGMFSKPAPNAAFTIKNIEPNVEDPSLRWLSGSRMDSSSSFEPWEERDPSDLLPSNSLEEESGSALLELDRLEIGELSDSSSYMCS